MEEEGSCEEEYRRLLLVPLPPLSRRLVVGGMFDRLPPLVRELSRCAVAVASCIRVVDADREWKFRVDDGRLLLLEARGSQSCGRDDDFDILLWREWESESARDEEECRPLLLAVFCLGLRTPEATIVVLCCVVSMVSLVLE